VPRLLAGEAVTTIAFDLNYSSPAAFTTVFKKLIGTTPIPIAGRHHEPLMSISRFAAVRARLPP
jgi:AraC-like DNA-binding protein